jgi:hypothetical protein
VLGNLGFSNLDKIVSSSNENWFVCAALTCEVHTIPCNLMFHENWPNKVMTASTFSLNYANTAIQYGFDEDHSTSLIRVVL